jgi:hypothetical protein
MLRAVSSRLKRCDDVQGRFTKGEARSNNPGEADDIEILVVR